MLHKQSIEPSALELLIELQSIDIFRDFHLAGGTSLALQIGHRKSIDLDLFTQNDFDVNQYLEYLEENYQFKTSYSSKNTLKGSIQDIKIDLISHKYPLVKNIISIEGTSLLSIEDIAAMKLNAIAGNGSRSKDFIDIYFILKNHTLNDILQYYNSKYSSRNVMHVVKSLCYFNDIDLQDWPNMIVEKDLSLSKIRRTITTYVNNYSKKYFE